jgi:hypothetical protein
VLILPNASGPIGEVAIQRGPRHGAFALTALAVPIMVLGATMHLYLPKVGLRVAPPSGSISSLLVCFGDPGFAGARAMLDVPVLRVDSDSATIDPTLAHVTVRRTQPPGDRSSRWWREVRGW